MSSRVLAFLVSLMLFASGVMASAPAMAAPEQHSLAVLAVAADAAGDELPAGQPAGHDQADSLLDLPDQLAGPSAPRDAALRSPGIEPDGAASLTHPDLEGPQRPPRTISPTA